MDYLNLTAGLSVKEKYPDARIVYIRSSHLESHAFNNLFYTLSDDLLYHLACGERCRIIDCTSNRCSKVIKTGIPLIKFVLAKYWFNREERPRKFSWEFLVRVISSLDKKTTAKLKGYKRFLNTDEVKLEGISYTIEKE